MSQYQTIQVFKHYTVGLVCALSTVIAVAQEAAPTAGARSFISSKFLKKASWRSATLVRSSQVAVGFDANLPPPPCGVRSYRMEYRVAVGDGKTVPASALLQVPDCAIDGGFPVMVYNHSTRIKKNEVPSFEPRDPEARGTAYLFASYGVLVLLPDYQGMGISKDAQLYLTRKTGERDVYDAIQATVEWAAQNKVQIGPELFLSGYSQGAHVTLSALQKLESAPVSGLELTGAAALSGIYGMDPEALAMILKKGSQAHSAFLLMAALTQYNLGPGDLPKSDEVFQSSYVAVGRQLLAGEIDFKKGMNLLPEKTADLFTPTYAAKIRGEKNQNALAQRLSRESVDNACYDTPLLVYASPSDETASADAARLAARRMMSQGSTVKLYVDTFKLDHINAALPAFFQTRLFFSELSPRMKRLLGTTFAPLKY
jgi:dienelactone hydrolase